MIRLTWSFYSSSTGLFDGTSFFGNESEMKMQLAHKVAGSLAFAGRANHTCQRVDLTSGELVDFIPTAPEDDDLKTWQWNSDRKVWSAVPTLLALRNARWSALKAERDSRLVGTFQFNGWVFQINQVSIAAAALDASLAKQGGDTSWAEAWVLADNTTQVLDAPSMLGVARAMKARISELMETSQRLRALVGAAPAEALDSIVWPE